MGFRESAGEDASVIVDQHVRPEGQLSLELHLLFFDGALDIFGQGNVEETGFEQFQERGHVAAQSALSFLRCGAENLAWVLLLTFFARSII